MNNRPVSLMLALLLIPVALSTAAAFPEQTPGLLHASLLNGVIVRPESGQFEVRGLQPVHLPDPPGGEYEAGGQDPARKLWAVLSTAAGQELGRLEFWAEKRDAPLWEIGAYRLILPGQPYAGSNPPLVLADGDYLLDFYLPAGKFYAFAFGVKTVNGKHQATGDWNTCAYFLYGRNDTEQPLVWKIWLRRLETGNRDGIATKIEITRDRDKKLIATSRPDNKQWLNDTWVRYDFDLIHPMQGTGGGAYLKAKDLLSQDGSYTLKMSMDGAPYGTWPFQVAAGQFLLTGRADRATADPLRFMYGGGAHWYQSTSTPQVAAGQMAPPPRHLAQDGMIPDCKGILSNGVILAPIGPIVTFLEAQSQWNAAARSLTITHNAQTLTLVVGQATAQGSGGPVALGVAPVVRDGALHAPVKAVAEALGAEVEWDAGRRLLKVIDDNRGGSIHVP